MAAPSLFLCLSDAKNNVEPLFDSFCSNVLGSRNWLIPGFYWNDDTSILGRLRQVVATCMRESANRVDHRGVGLHTVKVLNSFSVCILALFVALGVTGPFFF